MTVTQQAGRCGECGRTEADHQAADTELAAILNALAGCYGGYKITAAEAHQPPAPPVGARRRQFTAPTGATSMPHVNVTREILTVARLWRGDEFTAGLADAFGEAGAAGADYPWACDFACRLIFRPGSDPRELSGEARKHPIGQPQRGLPPEVVHARAAEALQGISRDPAAQDQAGAA